MNKVENFWDGASHNYDNTEKRFEYIHHQSREKARKFLRSNDRVLDYGCGTGTTSCELSDRVNTIQGIDISAKMIELSKEKAETLGVSNVNFTQDDIFSDQYAKESFDVIIAFNMLHTVPDPQRVIQRIRELLKPDGVFISVTPCLREKMSFITNIQIQLVRVLCKFGVIPVPIRRLKSKEIDRLLEVGGFKGIETEMIYKSASSYFVAAKKSENTL